jgi:hypothetical protein
MPARLTRQSFLNAVACRRLGWFSRRETPPVQLAPEQGTLSARFEAEQQREIHNRARALFADAAAVTRQAFEAACWQTQDLMDRASTTAILDAAFSSTTCRARADALVREGEEWHLYEVKASTAVSNTALDEIAFVWAVLRENGVQLGGASLVLLSQEYRAGMAEEALFDVVDVTSRTNARAEAFAQLLSSIHGETQTAEPPAGQIAPHCRRCRLFDSCVGAADEFPFFDLPHVTPMQLDTILQHGYRSVTEIPDTTLLKGRQVGAWRSITSGRAVLTGNLGADIDALSWPVRYLDLEAVRTALPLFPAVAPFEPVPFLYSIRTCDAPGVLQSHHAFLAQDRSESSRELAERLLQDAGSEGNIIVYSRSQARAIRWLVQRHPDLAEALGRVLNRLAVLEPLIRRHLSHPAFHGSTSFRVVLQALVPSFRYMDLEIEDAATAGASYSYLVKGGYFSARRAPLVRRDLYAYCARDTLALARLHEALVQIARNN